MARIPRRLSTRNHPQNTKISASTFSKRRVTTYRKASELSTLTGADVAIITFSLSSNNNNNNKPNCFGSPDVHSIVDRYLNNGTPNRQELQQINVTNDLIDKWNIMKREYEYQQHHAKVLERMIEERKSNNNWWDAPIETLNLGQLEELKMRLQNLVEQIDSHVNGADSVGSNNLQ